MITLETTTQFRRDYRRGYNMKLLGDVIDALLSGAPLNRATGIIR